MTGSYERARGGRAVGEHADGFTITASKTVAVPVERLYDAFVDATLRARWLPDGELRERTAIEPRSARFDWGDGACSCSVAPRSGWSKSTVALRASTSSPTLGGGRADEASGALMALLLFVDAG